MNYYVRTEYYLKEVTWIKVRTEYQTVDQDYLNNYTSDDHPRRTVKQIGNKTISQCWSGDMKRTIKRIFEPIVHI